MCTDSEQAAIWARPSLDDGLDNVKMINMYIVNMTEFGTIQFAFISLNMSAIMFYLCYLACRLY